MVTALRCFFHFLFLSGQTQSDLSGAVPSMPNWRLAELPKYLTPEEVERAGLKGRTFSTIFGLLAVTGLRVSEALALDREDVDLKEGILRIRRTKFGKSRLVAVHESTRQILADYARQRGQVVQPPRDRGLLPLRTGPPRDGVGHPLQLRLGLT